jgi:DNA-binding NarL/FixJ family response regulator
LRVARHKDSRFFGSPPSSEEPNAPDSLSSEQSQAQAATPSESQPAKEQAQAIDIALAPPFVDVSASFSTGVPSLAPSRLAQARAVVAGPDLDPAARALRLVGVSILAATSDTDKAVQLVARNWPDVLVVSRASFGAVGFSAVLRDAVKFAPGLVILVISRSGDPARINEVFEAGASAILARSESEEAMSMGIREVFGYLMLQPRERPWPLACWALEDVATGVSRFGEANLELTKGERELLTLLIAGQSTDEIARNLFISGKTVQTHLKNIYGKIGTERAHGALGDAPFSLIHKFVEFHERLETESPSNSLDFWVALHRKR